MAKAEFVMLAHDYVPGKHAINGWMVSEKLDGQRAIWDGGISRGVLKADVPYANVAKDERFVDAQYATGLWSRYGNVIHAPTPFLDQLPPFPLDGELSLGRGLKQETDSVVRTIVPGPGWGDVVYAIFDSPRWEWFLKDRTIDNKPNFMRRIKGAHDWARSRGPLFEQPVNNIEYDNLLRWLDRNIVPTSNLLVLPQEKLAIRTAQAEVQISDKAACIEVMGGEGLVLRNYLSLWKPERFYDILKHKPEKDDEATVTGYTWGRITDRGSKLYGMMGALIVLYNGKALELSGFTEAERSMSFHPFPDGRTAEQLQRVMTTDPNVFHGSVVSRDWHNPKFPIGSTVTFRYRELSRDGIPKEAKFHRRFSG